MATVNSYLRFQALLPKSSRYTITVTAVNSDGTSTGTTRGGGSVRVAGTEVTVGNKAWVEGKRIVGEAPTLTEFIEYV